jgi:hypothetical protein
MLHSLGFKTLLLQDPVQKVTEQMGYHDLSFAVGWLAIHFLLCLTVLCLPGYSFFHSFFFFLLNVKKKGWFRVVFSSFF